MNEQELNQAAASLADFPQRDHRPFADLTDAEKIARLHDAVRNLQRSIGWLQECAARCESIVQNHEHGRDGKPVVSPHTLTTGGGHVGSSWNPLA